MKTWHVCSNRWNSAITEYALSCAQACEQLGFEVLFSPLKETIGEHRSREYGFDTREFSNFGLGAVTKFLGTASSYSPDFVFLYGGPETFLSKFMLFSKAKKIRFWGELRDGGNVKLSGVERVLFPSRIVADSLRIADDKKAVVPLGCSTSIFTRVEADYLRRRPQVVVLGRLDPIKGHDRAVKIMKLVIESWQDWQRRPQLHIVGLPANLSAADIKSSVSQHGLKIDEDVIITPQRVPGISSLLSGSILGFVPSNGSEVICRVAEEFLLCGTPVVVSGVGALDEVLFEDAGASFKEMSDEQAAELVRSWIEKSLSEGEGAKKKRARRAQELFSLEAMAAGLQSKIFSS